MRPGQKKQEGVHCPFCGGCLSRVTDSRLAAVGGLQTTRRRRRCNDCRGRFTTFEVAEHVIAHIDRMVEAYSVSREAVLREAADKLLEMAKEVGHG